MLQRYISWWTIGNNEVKNDGLLLIFEWEVGYLANWLYGFNFHSKVENDENPPLEEEKGLRQNTIRARGEKKIK